MANPGATEGQSSIARALDYLMRNHVDADGNPATAERIAAGIDQKALSAPYIYALRSGNKKNPTVSALQLLSNYFGVGVGFFFEDDPAAAYARSRSTTSESPGVEREDEDSEHPGTTAVVADHPSTPHLDTDFPQPEPPATVDLAARLETLFRLCPRPDGAPWSLRQVSAAAKFRGVTLSVGLLHDLRRGIRDNPSKQQLEFLAEIFNVTPGYFFDDADTLAAVDKRLELLAAYEDEESKDIALRSRHLTPHDRRMVRALIESATRAQEDPDNAK